MPAPPNDLLANATVLSSGASVTGDSTDSTGETGDPLGTLSSVWFRWTCPAQYGGISVQFNTIDPVPASQLDTVLRILVKASGSDPVTDAANLNWATMIEDDESGGNHASLINFTPTNGTVYYIQLSGFGDVRGPYVLNYPDMGSAGAPVGPVDEAGTVFSVTGIKSKSIGQVIEYGLVGRTGPPLEVNTYLAVSIPETQIAISAGETLIAL